MHLPTLLLAALLTTASCAPTSANPSLRALTTRDSYHTCHSATLIKTTPARSPWAADCKGMIEKLNPASWLTLETSVPDRWFTFYGTCAFAIKAEGAALESPTYTIGYGDVIDLVSAAIAGLGQLAKVGAEGEMTCQAGEEGDEVELRWYLHLVDL